MKALYFEVLFSGSHSLYENVEDFYMVLAEVMHD